MWKQQVRAGKSQPNLLASFPSTVQKKFWNSHPPTHGQLRPSPLTDSWGKDLVWAASRCLFLQPLPLSVLHPCIQSVGSDLLPTDQVCPYTSILSYLCKLCVLMRQKYWPKNYLYQQGCKMYTINTFTSICLELKRQKMLHLKVRKKSCCVQQKEWKYINFLLKVHKIENFFGSDFEFCVISLLVMLKY